MSVGTSAFVALTAPLVQDETPDHFRRRDENGRWVEVPIAATEEEMRQREIDGLHRELEGVEWRLEHDDFSWEDPPPSTERVEQIRTGLEATRQVIYGKLAALGVEPPTPAKKGKR